MQPAGVVTFASFVVLARIEPIRLLSLFKNLTSHVVAYPRDLPLIGRMTYSVFPFMGNLTLVLPYAELNAALPSSVDIMPAPAAKLAQAD